MKKPIAKITKATKNEKKGGNPKMKYQASLMLYDNDFKYYFFEACASTEQAAINKTRKQAIKNGFNALNSSGQISVCKRGSCEYDANYYHYKIVLAWD